MFWLSSYFIVLDSTWAKYTFGTLKQQSAVTAVFCFP